jgi:PAS domain S-box-containing protein
MTLPNENSPANSTPLSPTRQESGWLGAADGVLLAQIVALIPDGIVCIDREWRITFANPEGRRLSEIQPHYINSDTIWNLYPRIVGTPLEQAYRSAMGTAHPIRLEHFSISSDQWLDVHVLPTPQGLTIIYRDLTDRKGAELLRDSASRQLHHVLDITTDAVISINREDRFTFLNRRAKELLAVKGDLLGKNLWDEFPFARENGLYFENYVRAMKQGIITEFEDYYPEPLNLTLAIQIQPSDEGVVIFFRDISARRKADKALRSQQQMLSTIQQSARVATWEADLQSEKIIFGEDSYPVFGHPFSELRRLSDFVKYIPGKHFERLAEMLRATRQSGDVIVIDFPIVAEDGSLLWIESRVQAILHDGDATTLRGLSIDITHRKRNEEALAASEARYRTLADLNPQAIWSASADGTPTYANQGLLDYLGFADENHFADDWLSGIHPDDRARVSAAWQHSIATGDDLDIEARMIRALDGRTRWWWIRAQPVLDENGRITSWLGVNADIDDRKTFAEMLQQKHEESEQQRAELETIYRTAPIGLALFDPIEFRYLRVNDRQVETLGLPREQILGRRIGELAPLKGIEDIFRQVAAGNSIRNYIFEGELPMRPGEHRYWNTNYSPIRNSDGEVEAIAAVIQEVTHLKKAEHALVQSEKLAAVGRLASSISHEINNPLEAITNLLYLIRHSEELPHSIDQYVITAQSELARVCQIATQTLRFHRQAVNPTYVTARDLVEAVLNLYQGRLVNSGIRVESGYFTSTPILCLENDIRQVLNNLIANAIDAMRHGGRLVVRAHDAIDLAPGREGHARGIRITIADTGHGMLPAVRERIFEPFYTTKELNGTGLGLWISQGIVDRHHGRLALRTSQHPVHHGSVFSLFLPCLDSVGQEEQKLAYWDEPMPPQ